MQILVATNGSHTFTMFNYGKVSETLSDVPMSVGIDVGDGIHYFNHKYHNSPEFLAKESNIPSRSLLGRWMYRVDSLNIGEDIICDTDKTDNHKFEVMRKFLFENPLTTHADDSTNIQDHTETMSRETYPQNTRTETTHVASEILIYQTERGSTDPGSTQLPEKSADPGPTQSPASSRDPGSTQPPTSLRDPGPTQKINSGPAEPPTSPQMSTIHTTNRTVTTTETRRPQETTMQTPVLQVTTVVIPSTQIPNISTELQETAGGPITGTSQTATKSEPTAQTLYDHEPRTQISTDQGSSTRSPSDPELSTQTPTEQELSKQTPTDLQLSTRIPTDPELSTLRPTDPELSTLRPTDPEQSTLRPTDPELSTLRPTDPELSTLRPTDPELSTLRPTDPELSTLRPTDPELSTLRPTDPELSTRTPTDSEAHVPTLIPTGPELSTQTPTDAEQSTLIPTDPELSTQTATDSELSTQTPTDPVLSTQIPTDPKLSSIIPIDPELSTQTSTDLELSTLIPTDPELSTQTPTDPELSTQTSTDRELSTPIKSDPELSTQAPTDPELSTQTSTDPELSTLIKTDPELSTQTPNDSELSTQTYTDPDLSTQTPTDPENSFAIFSTVITHVPETASVPVTAANRGGSTEGNTESVSTLKETIECDSDPCHNGGSCMDSSSGFECSCAAGFSGDTCAIDINECSSTPCFNGGRCIDGVNSYTCECPRAVEGVHCEIDNCNHTKFGLVKLLSEGQASSCQIVNYRLTNQASCLQETCSSGGNSVNFRNGECHIVRCYGDDLELTTDIAGHDVYTYLDFDPCDGIDCNNGICQSVIDQGNETPLCHCTAGFTGALCQNSLDPCFYSICQNGATCQSLDTSYICICPENIYGQFCDATIPDYTYSVRLVILSETFDLNLGDKQSNEYQYLKAQLFAPIQSQQDGVPFDVEFSPGSVVAHLKLGYHNPVSSDTVLATILKSFSKDGLNLEIELNNIQITTDVSLFSCDFEIDKCGMMSSPYGNFLWELTQGTSLSRVTGPSTIQQGLQYMLMNTRPRQYGQRAMLTIPSTPEFLLADDKVCIEFLYYMYGPDTGSLAWYHGNTSDITNPEYSELLWREGEYSVDEWQTGYIITRLHPKSQIVIIGAVGKGSLGDLAIDDIKFHMDLTICQSEIENEKCSPYKMGYDNVTDCGLTLWNESCLLAGSGNPLDNPDTVETLKYGTLNNFWWFARSLSWRANNGDLATVMACYGYATKYIRLTGNNEGRIEMYSSGVWGTVCDDGFTDDTARVFCRQLGYYDGEVRHNAYFGEGSGIIVFNNFRCEGNETSVFGCNPLDRFDQGWQCSHGEDVGVVCISEPEANFTVGPTVTERGNIDVTTGAVFLPSRKLVVPASGTIQAWDLYMVDPNEEITLQIWRYKSSLFSFQQNVESHQLIGQTRIKPSRLKTQITKGAYHYELEKPFDVNENDEIAFYFAGTNPIPYDINECYSDEERLRFVPNVLSGLEDGNEYQFNLASYATNPCRQYSAKAYIEKFETPKETTTTPDIPDVKLPQDVLYTCSFEYVEESSPSCVIPPNSGWTVITGKTPTDQTGPRGAVHGHRYAYVEATGKRPLEQVSWRTPWIYPNSSEVCLTAEYSLVGLSVDKLVLYLNDSLLLRTLKGPIAEDWSQTTISITSMGHPFQLLFTGIVGSDQLSDIAIDDIRIYDLKCEEIGQPGTTTREVEQTGTTEVMTSTTVKPIDLEPRNYYVSVLGGDDVDGCGLNIFSPCRSLSYVLRSGSGRPTIYLNGSDVYELDMAVVKQNKLELVLFGQYPGSNTKLKSIVRIADLVEVELAFSTVEYIFEFHYLELYGSFSILGGGAQMTFVMRNVIMKPQVPGVEVLSIFKDFSTLNLEFENVTIYGMAYQFSSNVYSSMNFRNLYVGDNEIGVGNFSADISGLLFTFHSVPTEGILNQFNLNFQNCTFNALSGMDQENVNVKAAVAIQATQQNAGLKIFFNGSSFLGNSRAIDIALKGTSVVEIKNCNFTQNTATGAGGAIRIAAYFAPGISANTFVGITTISIMNTIFYSNNATSSTSNLTSAELLKLLPPGSGGAIYIYITPPAPIRTSGSLTIENCSFVNNTADSQGGSLFVSPALFTIISECYFENSAIKNSIRARIGDMLFASSRLDVRFNTRSARGSTPVLYYQASDLLNDKMVASNFSLQCARGFTLDYQITTFSDGVQTLQIYCVPCRDDEYSIISATVTVNGVESVVQDQVTCWECPYGARCTEGIINRDHFWGKSGVNDEVLMYFCPENYCSLNDSTHVLYSHCEGDRIGTLCGECVSGFSEALFGTACIPNEQCGFHNWISLVVLGIYGLLYLLFFMFEDEWSRLLSTITRMISRKPKTEFERDDVSDSGYFPIFMYFVQTATLLKVKLVIEDEHENSIYKRPQTVLPDIMFDGLEQLLNLDFPNIQSRTCFFPDLKPIQKLALSMSFPLYLYALLFLIYIFSGFCCCCCKRKENAVLCQSGNTRILCTLLALFLYTYQGIAETLFELFNCIDVDGKKVLFLDGNVSCFQGWQIAVIVVVLVLIIPFFLVLLLGPKLLQENKLSLKLFFLGLILPIFVVPVVLITLCQRKEQIVDSNAKDKGVASKIVQKLSGPYRKRPINSNEWNADGTAQSADAPRQEALKGICWEGVFNLRRLILVVLYVFVSDKLIKQLSLTLFCFVFLMIHLNILPFKHKYPNHAETASLSILLVIAGANLVRAAFFHSGVVPRGDTYTIIVVMEWIEVICLSFLPLLLIALVVGILCFSGSKYVYNKRSGHTRASGMSLSQTTTSCITEQVHHTTGRETVSDDISLEPDYDNADNQSGIAEMEISERSTYVYFNG